MCPLWSFRSWIEPTSRPLSFTNSSVTRFTRAPLSIRQVVFTPSIIAVPKFEQLNHWFLGSSFQNVEGVNHGFASFWPGLDWPWPYPSGGVRLPWPPAPPSQFNDYLLRFACSFPRFKESLSGSVHSAKRWPSLLQLKQRPHRSASSAMAITAT